MTDGKHCPACGKDVGVWPIASALLPTLIRCPHCRTRLAYRGVGRLLAAAIVVAVAVSVGLLILVAWMRVHPALRLATFVALVLAAWVPVEVAVAVYLRRHKVLTRADEPPTG